MPVTSSSFDHYNYDSMKNSSVKNLLVHQIINKILRRLRMSCVRLQD